ncbi:hypothetical protein E4U15_001465 [Claviceps sp. LM218 group G6]|nr:hypothetical protein E4U15_001465 [Claviceps sp. LM218 group G6]
MSSLVHRTPPVSQRETQRLGHERILRLRTPHRILIFKVVKAASSSSLMLSKMLCDSTPPTGGDWRAAVENAGWAKLNKYYSLTDLSSAYVAAVVLHPALTWKWVKNKWNSRPSWIKDAEKRLEHLESSHPVISRHE